MKFKKPDNENYCATVVELKTMVDLTKCDNIQGAMIFGNQVIVSKDAKAGDVGVYFPAETQLSIEYASVNNLFRHSEHNADDSVKGYIEDNRRIRAMKMRGHQSCGLFMPLESLSYCHDKDKFEVGDTFDEIKSTKICNKYIVIRKQQKMPGSKKGRKRIRESKTITGQFRFHQDTTQLGKNLHMFAKNDIIQISYKMHGTSVIVSNVLCKKNINKFYKLLRWSGIKVVDTEYDNLYASRKVIKNDDLEKSIVDRSFYNADIWGLANDRLKEFLVDGLTIYAEVVGYLPTGQAIQKGFDYGCNMGEYEIYIYRITYTNVSGNVFEFSARQVQEWCKDRGLNPVLQLYYGIAQAIFNASSSSDYVRHYDQNLIFQDNFLNILKIMFLEKDCYMCKNQVPAEGIVVRREVLDYNAYKLKSFRFLELESKYHDKGEVDIEETN